ARERWRGVPAPLAQRGGASSALHMARRVVGAAARCAVRMPLEASVTRSGREQDKGGFSGGDNFFPPRRRYFRSFPRRRRQTHFSSATRLRSVPMPVISTSRTSPAF